MFVEVSFSSGFSDVCSRVDSGVNPGKHPAEMKSCFSHRLRHLILICSIADVNFHF